MKVNLFPDHHNYTRKDVELIVNRFNTMKGRTRILVPTEKDAVRLMNSPYFPRELKKYAFYLPIHVEIDRGESDRFIEALTKGIRRR